MKRNALDYSIRLKDNRKRLSFNCISKDGKQTFTINIYKQKESYNKPPYIIIFKFSNKDSKQDLEGKCSVWFDYVDTIIEYIRTFLNGSDFTVDSKIKESIKNNLERLKEGE